MRSITASALDYRLLLRVYIKMCGINGFTFRDEALLRAMNSLTSHRGPDGTGVYVNNGVSLGHNRLKIIDLSDRGHQPMHSRDDRFIISFNGEIYNYRELRSTVDYPFKSESDTEVILALFERDGTKAFSLLKGIFALALLDTHSQVLYLARDRAGVKPLYYFWDPSRAPGRCIFSSEIKAILLHDIPRELDRTAFNLYFSLLYVPGPRTLFSHIAKLPPGSVATLSLAPSEGAESCRSIVIEPFRSGEGQGEDSHPPRRSLSEEVVSQVERAVASQLVSDRPVGISLSGGLDSNILLDIVSRHQARPHTYSVGYVLDSAEESERFNEDFNLARRSAARYGAVHHEIRIDASDFDRTFEQVVWHLDEPVSNATTIPMFALSRLASESVAVLLSGDGGDEIFGGYNRYRMSRLISLFQTLPSLAQSLLRPLLRRPALSLPIGFERFLHFTVERPALLRPLLSSPGFDTDAVLAHLTERYGTREPADFENHFMAVDRVGWLVDESLLRSDKMSMAHGVEMRVPFLDPDLVAFASTIPSRLKVTPFQSKALLRRAFRGRLPREIIDQRKRGWFSPIAKWLRRPATLSWVRDALRPSFAPATEHLFQWDYVARLLDQHVSRQAYNRNQLLSLLFFQVWARKFNIQASWTSTSPHLPHCPAGSPAYATLYARSGGG